jgi:heme A synthase
VRGAWIAAGLLATQLLVGALNVWLDEYEALIVGHLALGTLLWMTLVGLALQLFRIPKPVESSPDASSREALTA